MDFYEIVLLGLAIAGMLFALGVSASLKLTYARYSKEISNSGYTATEVADMILRRAGINYVSLEAIQGDLTDHFDPRNNVLRLSDSVRNSKSIAAIGVAAHECGHAIQHDVGYKAIKVRNAILPSAQIGSKLSMPIIMIGLLLGQYGGYTLLLIGVILFSLTVIFQLVTLPVEFDASNRALKILKSEGFLSGSENKKAAKVLRAAALTYVAGVVNALIQLLRLIYILNSSNSRRR